MKKINSIGYGHKILGLGAGLLVPGAVLAGLGRRPGAGWLWVAGVGALAAGGLVLLGFALLLAVELGQDKRIDRRYQSGLRRQKLQTPGGRAECQHCGATLPNAEASHCPACGIRFGAPTE